MRPDPRAAVRLASSLPGSRQVGRLGLALPRRARRAFRGRVSGDPSGTPSWVQEIGYVGTGPGWFEPDGVVWRVHGDLSTLVGGVAALLGQATHPLAVAGVERHSSYRDDPWKRLAGTARWLVVTTFGSAELAEREAARVRAMHGRVRGTLEDGRRYDASSPELLRWVHLSFTDAFLHARQHLGDDLRQRFGPRWPDAYVGEWARSAAALGASDLPTTATELDEAVREAAPALDPAPPALRAFLLSPPGLNVAERAFYVSLARAGGLLTHPVVAPLAGVPGRTAMAGPRRLEVAAVRAELRALQLVLGGRSPSEEAARRRLGVG